MVNTVKMYSMLTGRSQKKEKEKKTFMVIRHQVAHSIQENIRFISHSSYIKVSSNITFILLSGHVYSSCPVTLKTKRRPLLKKTGVN